MERQKKRGGLNKNSENDEKYKFSYCFALLEKEVFSSFQQLFLEELKGNEEKKKERRKRNCN